jgi:hypothetical protein
MKKLLLFILFIISFMHATDAQWYYRTCGVPELSDLTRLEYECLWDRSTRNVNVGTITTTIGIVSAAASISIVVMAFNGSLDGGVVSPEFLDHMFVITALGAFICITVGSGIWITGVSRQKQLKKTPYYKNRKLGTLYIAPTISRNQFNNIYAFGLSVSLSF